jgi:hypothetical protein
MSNEIAFKPDEVMETATVPISPSRILIRNFLALSQARFWFWSGSLV